MIRCYLSGNPVHDRVIRAFYDGLPEPKELIKDWDYKPSEVAVVFGVGKSQVPVSWPRRQVIAQQRNNKCDVVVLETGYINRGDGENHHYAAGWNGLNGRADFVNKGMPSDRAEKLGVNLWPYSEGDDVILCGQVPWDASVDHTDHIEWIMQTAESLKGLTERNIVFRPHPLARLPALNGCEYSTRPLADDLPLAHAVVTFNSNSAVEALVSGKPVFSFDEGSMVWNVSNRDLSQIDNPWKPQRQQWLNDLCYAQWTIDEMRSGEAWQHLSR